MISEPGRAGKAWAAIFEYSRANRLRVLGAAAGITATIALVDLALVRTIALGFLYIIPLVVAAGFLKRWQIAALALISALLREAGSPTAWSSEYLARIALVATAFAGTAFFVKELARNEQLALERVKELKARQELERQLRHAQRLEAVGRLAGGVAHDFNNLLSVIIGYSDLALRPMEPEAALRRDVVEIRKSAQRAASLTRQLLEFSRRDILQPKVTDLNWLVSNLSNMLQLVAEGNSSKEIANLLNLSAYTVETHRARVMQKLKLRGIPELTLYAVRKGIIS